MRNGLKTSYRTVVAGCIFAVGWCVAVAYSAEPSGGKAVSLAQLSENFDGPESFDPRLRGLLGRTGVWDVKLHEGHLYFGNTTGETNIHFLRWMSIDGQSEPVDGLSHATVAVDVGGRFIGKHAAAGLIYRYRPDSGNYFAFVLTKDGEFAFYRRDAAGYRRVTGGHHPAIVPDRMNRLRITSKDARVNLSINDVDVTSFKDAKFDRGGVGILAAGTGHFYFDNLTVDVP